MADIPPTPAGRAAETAAVEHLLRDAKAGQSSTLLVSGEPGAGKTFLVSCACAARDGVVWVSCLPLASLQVPLLPLRSASGLDSPPRWDATYPVLEVDAWLDRACADRPVTLVVDDVQWADQSTLDVLMYAIAGRPDRRLAVILTMRSGPDGDRLRPWLADVRRLPRFHEITLGRLDRAATADQIAGALGEPPHSTLIDVVYARSTGNPYLTSLLVAGLAPDATALPDHLPDALRDALSRAWHRLPPVAQDITITIAVAGRPQHAADVGVADPVPALRAAVDGGVLHTGPDGRYWFTHPLLAEVLAEALLPEERRARHAAFAAALDRPGDGDADADRAIALAGHYEKAGDDVRAYRWALRAAGLTGAGSEALRLLHHALRLWPRVPAPAETRSELLRRLAAAARRAGRDADELAATRQLIDLADPGTPELAVLLVSRYDLLVSCGRALLDTSDLRRALAITGVAPASPEHARVLGRTALDLLFISDPDGPALASEAIRRAEAQGEPDLIATALVAGAMALVTRGDPEALCAGERAWDAAARAGDPLTLTEAACAWANAGVTLRPAEHARIYRRCAEHLESVGAPHSFVSLMCAHEAVALLTAGEWDQCADRLRVALGSRPGPMGDACARLVAADLACCQGRRKEAEAHLTRAEEIFEVTSEYVFFPFDAVRMRLAVTAGDADRAVAIARDALARHMPAVLAEWLLPWAVQALADAPGDRAAAVREMEALLREHPDVALDPSMGNAETYGVRAARAVLAGEIERCRRTPAEATAWLNAAEVGADAGMSYVQAYARWRRAQALLRDRSKRGVATPDLRAAATIARRLGAAPLLAEITALARDARIDLAPEPAPPPVEALPGLTRREREILGHVVAGRTYSEIARALVLSEKTVSTHISNMLRKTGTVNRIELAGRARAENDGAYPVSIVTQSGPRS
ncbi:LuxR C-terminal-related transcriptional regulator [Actinoplanes sp. CA-054009]